LHLKLYLKRFQTKTITISPDELTPTFSETTFLTDLPDVTRLFPTHFQRRSFPPQSDEPASTTTVIKDGQNPLQNRENIWMKTMKSAISTSFST
jgi:hypothetical protein